ncbi:MAG TPA: type II toxin-antitoxin system VapB family antitoxin [Thermoanaerobaculia bacterium]|nr:type II toxin-antitoxin system VapB family antitoxin [Thermoanaerobaculia bacterium]
MRLEIDLDDDLVTEAMRVSGITELEDLIREALRFLIAQHRRPSLLDLEGKIEFAPGYDHKVLREAPPGHECPGYKSKKPGKPGSRGCDLN